MMGDAQKNANCRIVAALKLLILCRPPGQQISTQLEENESSHPRAPNIRQVLPDGAVDPMVRWCDAPAIGFMKLTGPARTEARGSGPASTRSLILGVPGMLPCLPPPSNKGEVAWPQEARTTAEARPCRLAATGSATPLQWSETDQPSGRGKSTMFWLYPRVHLVFTFLPAAPARAE